MYFITGARWSATEHQQCIWWSQGNTGGRQCAHSAGEKQLSHQSKQEGIAGKLRYYFAI